MQELAYSIHLGSDKNRSKLGKRVAKNNPSDTASLSNNAIQNSQQLSKVNKHNLRDYDKKVEDIEVVYGTNDLYQDVKNVYLQEFQEAQIEYDNKVRKDRQIGDYFTHISKDSKHDLACELIIELGDMDFWKDKTMEYKKQMTEVYKDQIYKFVEVVSAFKVANAVVHYDETSPHMHLVGVPVKDGYKNGMKKQVAKSQIFTKASLKEILNNLKSPLLDKNNKLISNDNIYKVLNYTEEVKDTTKSIKGVNDLNIAIDKVEKNYRNLENERVRLYNSNTEKDKTIADLKETIEAKDDKINKLESALNKLKIELSKFKEFWRRLIKRFQIKVFDEDFEKVPDDKRSYTIVAEDLERSGIFDNNDSDIVHNPTKKVLTNEELAEIQAKKGKKKSDYNLG